MTYRRIQTRSGRKALSALAGMYLQELKQSLEAQGKKFTPELLREFIKWKAADDAVRFHQSNMDKELIIRNRIDALDLTLPNGKKGVSYSHILTVPTELADTYSLEGLEGSGLTVSAVYEGQCKISGVPEIANDYELTLKYHCAGAAPDSGTFTRAVRLTVNPDPRDLWKDIPTPTDIAYYKPDCDSAYIKVESEDGRPRKDITAASRRGRSHAHEGKPRDDDFKLYYNPDNEWYVIAVADGAGSAKYSRQGAKTAVEAAVQSCVSSLSDPASLEKAICAYKANSADDASRKNMGDQIYRTVGSAAFRANRAIHEFQEANNPESNVRDFSTTLLLAICKRFSFGWFVASFWVGDGAMAIYSHDRKYLKVLGEPDGGEYAGQTRFLTMDSIFSNPSDIMKRLRFSIEDDFTALMLMTDGVSDAKFETDANLGRIEKWDALWNELTAAVNLTDDNEASKDELLEWLNFWSAGNHDDRTIAILY